MLYLTVCCTKKFSIFAWMKKTNLVEVKSEIDFVLYKYEIKRNQVMNTMIKSIKICVKKKILLVILAIFFMCGYLIVVL